MTHKISDPPSPKNIRELRKFQGCTTYIGKLIYNLSGKCEPFSKLTRNHEWDEDCQNAFDSINAYLTKPPFARQLKVNH